MQRCTARAAGGTINRLNPTPAIVFSRSKNDDISGPYPSLCFVAGRDICATRRTRCSISSELVTLLVRRTATWVATWITLRARLGASTSAGGAEVENRDIR